MSFCFPGREVRRRMFYPYAECLVVRKKWSFTLKML
ncbi:unnamed protein product [Brassica rapa subsp. trilocularis]